MNHVFVSWQGWRLHISVLTLKELYHNMVLDDLIPYGCPRSKFWLHDGSDGRQPRPFAIVIQVRRYYICQNYRDTAHCLGASDDTCEMGPTRT